MNHKNGNGTAESGQVNFRAGAQVARLLAVIVGAEQMRRPAERVTKQSILTEAFLEYAKRRHRRLIPKGL